MRQIKYRNIEDAIYWTYDIQLPKIRPDSGMHSFRIDDFRIGFVTSFGDQGAFGCWSDGDIWCYSNGYVSHIKANSPDIESYSKATRCKYEHARAVIDIAKCAKESGKPLSSDEKEELYAAVKFVDSVS